MLGTVQPCLILALLLSLHATDCDATSQGLSCVNDFINNVTCTWHRSSADASRDCWITGHKIKSMMESNSTVISQNCKVQDRANSAPGCSFVFENNTFTHFETMPIINTTCNRTLILKDYLADRHIQMHPPGLPNVTCADNETVIRWGPSSPLSKLLDNLEYEVHIQHSDPKMEETHTFHSSKPTARIPAWKLKGKYQVRVRVKPEDMEGSIWSEWSPTTVWATLSENTGWGLDATYFILAVFIIMAVIAMMLAFYKSIVNKRLFKAKPVPNPSKYFQSLHSVHSGNLKKWLNPHCAAEILDTTQPVDHISPVEVCESRGMGPNNATCAPPPPSPSDSNRLVENSPASSGFSNLDYFVSGSSGSSLPTDPYFAYKDDAHMLHKAQHLHLTNTSLSWESVRSSAQSPDSGFCVGKEDVEIKDEQNTSGEEDQVSGHLSSSQLSLPLNIPVQISGPSSPPPLSQISADSAPTQPLMLAANVSAAGWPVQCTMHRSSSMPVESSKAGYFLLQEIQTTFSNASI
ncbi:interleukin-2 receptor subunit beta [Nerophis lumbriciformis]|uniref:interleukin-2 receptor subunit beta n=1 Tax=Nerophis lumbriciformis TaxID=546530 RepID=UPI003BA926A6